MTKSMSPSSLRDDMPKSLRPSYSPEFVPRAIMEANKKNSSLEWDEEADASGFDTHVMDGIRNYEQAIKVLVARGSKDRSK